MLYSYAVGYGSAILDSVWLWRYKLHTFSDPFVKITLAYNDKWMKTRKTSSKRNTIDPVYNESFHFNLNQEQLNTCCLLVSVWDRNNTKTKDFVGRIIMGKQNTGSHEVTHWNRMLQCHRSPVAQWHTLRMRSECEQKCPISSLVHWLHYNQNFPNACSAPCWST